MVYPKEPFKVFISHATKQDGALATWIAASLDLLQTRAFIYENYQRGGQNRFEVIKYQIQACPYFLAILTRDGLMSQWVNQEIGYAIGLGKEIIPIIEIEPLTGRLNSNGFVELHDPIYYNRGNENLLMSQIIYTFYSLHTWQDKVFLSCKCGYSDYAKLEFEKWWFKWNSDPTRTHFPIAWTCPSCQRQMGISFPDCHLLPQT